MVAAQMISLKCQSIGRKRGLPWPENKAHKNMGDNSATRRRRAPHKVDSISPSPPLAIKLSEFMIRTPLQSNRFPKKFGCCEMLQRPSLQNWPGFLALKHHF